MTQVDVCLFPLFLSHSLTALTHRQLSILSNFDSIHTHTHLRQPHTYIHIPTRRALQTRTSPTSTNKHVRHLVMEFSTSPSSPLILHPECEKDWAHQHHALEHTLRWNEAKQTDSLPLRRSSVLSIKRQASQSDVSRRPAEKRRRINKPAVVTRQRNAVEKSRSSGDWEQLLNSSIRSLQGLYEKMDAPVVPRSQVLGDRFNIRLVETDATTMASQAMHRASGCCSEGGINEDDSDRSSSSETEDSSDSDNNSEGPATPDAMHFNEDIDIDIDHVPGGDARVPPWGAYSHSR